MKQPADGVLVQVSREESDAKFAVSRVGQGIWRRRRGCAMQASKTLLRVAIVLSLVSEIEKHRAGVRGQVAADTVGMAAFELRGQPTPPELNFIHILVDGRQDCGRENSQFRARRD